MPASHVQPPKSLPQAVKALQELLDNQDVEQYDHAGENIKKLLTASADF
jgi:hypothetical protein